MEWQQEEAQEKQREEGQFLGSTVSLCIKRSGFIDSLLQCVCIQQQSRDIGSDGHPQHPDCKCGGDCGPEVPNRSQCVRAEVISHIYDAMCIGVRVHASDEEVSIKPVNAELVHQNRNVNNKRMKINQKCYCTTDVERPKLSHDYYS